MDGIERLDAGIEVDHARGWGLDGEHDIMGVDWRLSSDVSCVGLRVYEWNDYGNWVTLAFIGILSSLTFNGLSKLIVGDLLCRYWPAYSADTSCSGDLVNQDGEYTTEIHRDPKLFLL